MNGNVCRCGTYRRIVRAIHAAAQTQQGGTAMNLAQGKQNKTRMSLQFP